MGRPSGGNQCAAPGKLKLYARHGYVPFHNLIVTFETEREPFDAAQINMVMDYFF